MTLLWRPPNIRIDLARFRQRIRIDVYKRQIYNCSNVVDNYLFGQGMDKLGYMEDSIATYWGAF